MEQGSWVVLVGLTIFGCCSPPSVLAGTVGRLTVLFWLLPIGRISIAGLMVMLGWVSWPS